MFLSKLYRQMYAGTGISTDSARRKKSKTWARWTARQCRKLFSGKANAGAAVAYKWGCVRIGLTAEPSCGPPERLSGLLKNSIFACHSDVEQEY